MLGERRGGDRLVATAAPLGPVLGHPQAQRWQVEHLPGLDPGDRRVGQVHAAPAAPVGHLLDDLGRLGDLGQVGAGLLAGPARGRLSHPRFDPTGLAQPVRGRRLGGVGGVLAEPTLQLGHPRLQRGDQPGLLGVDRGQGGVGRPQLNNDRSLDCDGGFQIELGRRDRGLQDNQRSRPLAHGPCRTATPAAAPGQPAAAVMAAAFAHLAGAPRR
jgi:hypothetical protein